MRARRSGEALTSTVAWWGSSWLTTFITLLAFTASAAAQAPPRVTGTEPIIGGPCEGCEAVFEGIPDDPPSTVRIAPADEPGEPLRIRGVVTDRGGRPAPGVVVYAYHTDAEGIYPRDEHLSGSAARHGRLRAWATTDADGRYEFETILPGHYPGRDAPRHVHMHVIEPGCCTYYIDSIHFTDDPLLDEAARRDTADARGGSGLVTPRRGDAGSWVVERDIRLGRNVPGYEEARAAASS